MVIREHSMVDIAPTVSAILGLPVPAQACGTAIPKIVADPRGFPRVAILVTDSFGVFAWELWRTEMPYLDSLHVQRTIRLHSVIPSITPVNFAAMVTGTDLAGHGVHTLADDFVCETLFDVVRAAHRKSAGVGMEGYTGSELLGRCADIWGNAGLGSDDAVAATTIEIADRDQPEFLIVQLGRVDDVFHRYGPSSPSVVPMLRETDVRLKKLVAHLKPLRYGVLILSDHGQHDVIEPLPGGLRGSHGKDIPEDCVVPCTWA